MTRVFLAAGVAALAIATPANAGPHGGGGGRDRQAAVVTRGGGGGAGQRAFAAPRMQRQAFAAPRLQRQAFAAPRMERQQRFAAIERPQRSERVQMRAQRQHVQTRMAQRQQIRANRQQAQTRMAERQQMRASRQQAQTRMAARQQLRANRVQKAQNLRAQRAQQAQTRLAERQQMRVNRQQQLQTQLAQRQQLRANRVLGPNVKTRMAANNGVGFGVGGCPPGLASKGCMPPGLARQQGLQALQGFRQMAVQDRIATLRSLGEARFAPVDIIPRTRILEPLAANALIGMPLASAATFATLSPLPADMSFLFPATSNSFFEFGNGFAFQVDRQTQLIDALFPLLGGGFVPGSFLPSPYMNSFVPASFGFNSFYPDYGNTCYRYGNGVIYQVDCFSGFVENVIPMYAGGYGVGQLLPSAYNYYNVPMQYRSLYYPTADYSYWYAPGAIYQYNPSNSLITSVAALMSPGFTIGQPLPVGYGMYNVPLAYRSTYFDTPDAWYRYNNGYIYQVDPTSQLVTAVVASLLT